MYNFDDCDRYNALDMPEVFNCWVGDKCKFTARDDSQGEIYWMKNGRTQKRVISEYELQALDFMAKTDTTLEVHYTGNRKYFHDDKESRDCYSFTIKRNGRKEYSGAYGTSVISTKRREYAMKYGNHFGSKDPGPQLARQYLLPAKFNNKDLADWKRGPSPYDILACLSGYEPPLLFEDFCSEYGYDDMPMGKAQEVMSIHQNVIREWEGLRQLFNPEELDQLAEIQ